MADVQVMPAISSEDVVAAHARTVLTVVWMRLWTT
jgi:hypothetical protein